jgi:hypothetical protein
MLVPRLSHYIRLIGSFTMIKALLLSVVAATATAHKGPKGHGPPEPVMNMCNNTCLTLEVSDFYGDGWDSVEFHGEEEGGAAMSMAPDCMHKKLSTQICPDKDGTYYFTAAHANSSYIPENYWEVFWTATSHNCDGSVANVYTGGFNSSLIMDYMGNSWSVQYWENLWDNEKKCDACGDAKQCKPKKSKGKGKGGKGGKKPGNAGGKPLEGGMSNTTHVAKPKPRYGPPAVNLRVTMFDEDGDGWWMNDYSGESWYLADDRREKLFHTGTLCDGSVGSCNLCLGDGSYTMRFTGEASNFTAWDFCGVTGQRAQELTFHVLKGACYADSIVSLHTDCMGSVESHVTLTGVVAMSGFTTEFADKSTYSVVSNTLADMITGFSAENVQVLSTSLDSRVMSSSVSNVVQDYTFEVTFVAENSPFNTDGRSYAAVESLASSIATTLSSAMSSGQFETKLQLESSLQNVVSLSAQAVAELVSLEVSSVTYVGSEGMISSTLPTLSWSDYYQSSSDSNAGFEVGVTFFGAVVVGFVAFVGIMSQGIKKYESLPMDSTHNEVFSSDMDASISPQVEQSVFQVDATPINTNNL